jgi:hypothetical protein
MAPLAQAEKDVILTQIAQQLSQTPYASSSLIELSNGTTNFVFRGILAQSLPNQDGNGLLSSTSVIIKHSTDFVPLNRDFPLDVSRCVSLFLLHILRIKA